MFLAKSNPHSLMAIAPLHLIKYSKEFSKDVDTKLLNKKANTKLSHDGMFHTLLGLMNVDTFVYKKSWITFVISNKLMALRLNPY